MSKQFKDFDEVSSVAGADWILTQPNAGGIYTKIQKQNLFSGLQTSGSSSPLATGNIAISASIGAGATATVNAFIANSFALNRLTSNSGLLRIRAYLSAAFAAADYSRAIGGSLPISHGMIYECVMPSGTSSLDVLPTAFGAPNGDTYFNITNNDTTPINLSLILYYTKIN
ncbi:MAG: hypothetical protein KA716_31885 [Gloeotrichia echinulata DEX184]|nr:hypothetical protein [Gloeotrichia echinulata DEX184]MCM0594537.1 hypothetical protein [Gloeotrichia echinulata DEX184]